MGKPPPEECPQEGPEGVLRSWDHGVGLCMGDRSGLDQPMVLASLPSRGGRSPRACSMFICCTDTCVGALVKNVNGAAPCLCANGLWFAEASSCWGR